jgi:uncharacterized protein
MASSIRADSRLISPVRFSERIISLDVLRGVALLGILLMNIQSFSQPHYDSPLAYGDFHGGNFVVWLFSHIFANLKFLSIFSMLFGAGICLFCGRIEAAGKASGWLHYRRMAILIVFGLIHGYFLWFGDILVHYGICGMLAYPLRKLPPRRLLVIGAILLVVPIVAGFFYIGSMGPEEIRNFQSELHPSAAQVASDLAAYRAGWLGQESTRASAAFEFETTVFGWEYFWRELGLMIVGMALFRRGVFSAKLLRAEYIQMVAVAIVVGIPLTLYGAFENYRVGWQSLQIFFLGEGIDYVASLFIAFGWVGAVMLVCKSVAAMPYARPLQAVGRAAFSNYIFQTLICTTLFYGHGFGLYGRVSRVGQLAMVVMIWIWQIVLSSFWFHYFRMGPLESLWRTLTYWKPQPVRGANSMASLTYHRP